MMSSNDAILDYLGICIRRASFFVLLVLVQTLAGWLWFWLHFKAMGLLDSLRLGARAWPLDSGRLLSVLALGMLWMSSANTTILFLLFGRWWKLRGDVLYRRGNRFIDERGEN